MSKTLDLDQPRADGGTFERKDGIRAVTEGSLTEVEQKSLAELRRMIKDQPWRDELIVNLAARLMLADDKMFEAFMKTAREGGDLESLFGRVVASTGAITRIIKDVERREGSRVMTITDYVEVADEEADEIEDGDEDTE